MNTKQAILKSLKRGERLTGLTIFRKTGSLSGDRRLRELRAEGHPIRDESVKLRSGKRVKRYWMAA